MTAAPPSATAWREATIERIVARTPRVSSVFLRTPMRRHVAGQHVDVRLTAEDGYQAQRAYSIASVPGDPSVELAIEVLPDGEVSPYFHDVARPGDTVEVRGPLGGHFAWSAGDGGPVVMIGGGSGVVPLVSMARDRAQAAREVPALLVHSARTWDDVIFRDELVAMDDAREGLTLAIATTRGPRGRPQDREGRLDASSLAAIVREWGHGPRLAYVCGGDAFVEAMARALVASGMPAAAVRTERYGGGERA